MEEFWINLRVLIKSKLFVWFLFKFNVWLIFEFEIAIMVAGLDS